MDSDTLKYMRTRVETADRLHNQIGDLAHKRRLVESPSAAVALPATSGGYYKVVPLNDMARKTTLDQIDAQIATLREELAEL